MPGVRERCLHPRGCLPRLRIPLANSPKYPPITAVSPARRPRSSGGHTAAAVLGVIVLLLCCVAAIGKLSTAGGTADGDRPSHLSAYNDATNYIKEHYYSDAEFRIGSAEFTDHDTYTAVNGSFSHGGVVYQYIVKVAAGGVSSCDIYKQ